jgi:pimeloyl-ACP methyl ester carboxylesterase
MATGPQWSGARALAGGKGYAPCPLGQLHYRDLGPRRKTPFLLLHQTPLSMIEFADVQPLMAQRGRRSVAIDNPGFGLSDPAPEHVTVEQLADNLLGLLEHLQIGRVIVAGHHTGAAIAAAFAARHPRRTACVILHGTPLYSASERAERLARPAGDMELKPDGSHLSGMFKPIYGIMGPDPSNLSTATWATLGAFMAGPAPPAYKAVFAHDMAPDLLAIRAPTLILSDSHDILAANDSRAARLRPDFTLREFSSGGSPALTQHAPLWVETVLRFATERAL